MTPNPSMREKVSNKGFNYVLLLPFLSPSLSLSLSFYNLICLYITCGTIYILYLCKWMRMFHIFFWNILLHIFL